MAMIAHQSLKTDLRARLGRSRAAWRGEHCESRTMAIVSRARAWSAAARAFLALAAALPLVSCLTPAAFAETPVIELGASNAPVCFKGGLPATIIITVFGDVGTPAVSASSGTLGSLAGGGSSPGGGVTYTCTWTPAGVGAATITASDSLGSATITVTAYVSLGTLNLTNSALSVPCEGDNSTSLWLTNTTCPGTGASWCMIASADLDLTFASTPESATVSVTNTAPTNGTAIVYATSKDDSSQQDCAAIDTLISCECTDHADRGMYYQLCTDCSCSPAFGIPSTNLQQTVTGSPPCLETAMMTCTVDSSTNFWESLDVNTPGSATVGTCTYSPSIWTASVDFCPCGKTIQSAIFDVYCSTTDPSATDYRRGRRSTWWCWRAATNQCYFITSWTTNSSGFLVSGGAVLTNCLPNGN